MIRRRTVALSSLGLRTYVVIRFSIFSFVLVAPVFVHAAGLRARLVDQSKKALSKVECRLVNVQSGEAVARASDKKGEVRFEKLAPGPYQLYAQQEGYLAAKSEVVQITEQDLEIKLLLPQEQTLRKTESNGNVAFEHQDYSKALGLYEEALSLAPWDATLRSNVMLSLIRLKQGDKARQVAQRAAKYDPAEFDSKHKEILAWIALEEGKLYVEEQQFDKAVAALTEAIQSNNQNAEAFYSLALAYGHQRQYSEALKNINEALKLKPGEASYTNVKKILENNARATGK